MVVILIIIVFLVTGFCIAFYAICACPSGQLDEAFWDPFEFTVEREIAKEIEKEEQSQQ